MSDDRGQHRDGFRKQVFDLATEALAKRAQLRDETPRPSDRTVADAVKAAANFQEELEKYADARSLQKDFDERLPFDPDGLLFTTVTVQQAVESRNRQATQPIQVQLATQVPAEKIIEHGRELNKIAKELGFAAEIKQSRDQFHIASPEDDHPEPVNDNVKKPGQ